MIDINDHLDAGQEVTPLLEFQMVIVCRDSGLVLNLLVLAHGFEHAGT